MLEQHNMGRLLSHLRLEAAELYKIQVVVISNIQMSHTMLLCQVLQLFCGLSSSFI
jgi:hypothetical protein